MVYLCRVDRTDDTAKSAVADSGGTAMVLIAETPWRNKKQNAVMNVVIEY